MSSGAELLVLPLLPVGLVLGGAALLAGGVFRAGNSAADGLAAAHQRRLESAARADRARFEHDALLRRVQEARGRHGAAITLPERLPASAFRPGNPAVVDQVRAWVADVEPRLRAELARAGTAALVAGLRVALAGVADAGGPVRPAPAGPDPERQRVIGTVERVLGRLETATPAGTRAALEARAAEALAASAGRADLLVSDLRAGVQRANEQVVARRTRLADLHGRLDLVSGEAADEVRRRLYAAADGPEPDWPALTTAVDATVEAAVAEALSRYAAHAVREALEEAGCEVEPDFDVLLVEDGEAHVRPAGWQGMAVRVRRHEGDSTRQALALSVVAADPSTLDETAEREWCGALDDLLPALAVRGIRPRLERRSELGEQPAEQVEDLPFDRAEPVVRRRRKDQAVARHRTRP